jgi:hypothetical protein
MWRRFVVLTLVLGSITAGCSDESRALEPLVQFTDIPVVEPRELYLVNTSGGSSTIVSRTANWPRVEWSPNAGSFRLFTDPVTVPGRINIIVPEPLESFTFSGAEWTQAQEIITQPSSLEPKGGTVSLTSGDLVFEDPQGKQEVLVASEADWEITDPRLSPDGNWVTYQRYHSSSVLRQYELDLDGGMRRLPDLSRSSRSEAPIASDFEIASPTGSAIAVYVHEWPSGTGVHISRDGERQLLANTTGNLLDLRWSDKDTLYLVTDVIEYAE